MSEDNNNSSWSNLNRDGRRLEQIIKFCYTMSMDNEKGDSDVRLSYIDRLLKATHEKVEIAKVVTAVDKLLKAKRSIYV
jgi:hypothetical protein